MGPRHLARRHWLSTAAAVAGTGLAAGCQRHDDRTVRFWAMGREGEVAAELVAGFEREHPGVQVQVEALPWTAAHEKLLTAFAGDATPDVAQLGNTWLPEMAALGALEPLQPWLAAAPEIRADDHFAGIWATNLVPDASGGRPQRLGLPWYVDTRLLFYRRDLLAQVGWPQPPTDWDDWLRCMAALQQRAGVRTPILLPTNEFEPLLALALQQPGELLRDGGRFGGFAGPAFQRALDFYLTLFARGLAPGITNNQVANLWQEFGRGLFAFYISGPWQIGEFKRRLPAELQGSWATAPLPGPVAGAGIGASIAGGASLVMFRRSRVKPLAWALMAYLARPEVQRRFYQLTGNLPPRRSSWALAGAAGQGGATLAEDVHARAFAQQLENVRPAPAVPEWERIAQEMQLTAARAVHQRADAATALRLAQGLDARVDAILEKRRWMLARQSPALTWWRPGRASLA
ncbi:MAG: sugar ABC transporter substrate-binding protein [Burkholderiaceae bacterium]|nr:sugar ABC transporter substrate-binding protein [Burkholderiaceae bacterium]